MAKRLKNMSHEMIHALKDYIEKNKLFLSDVLVSFFGCHLVTRLHKEILTSESNHACFFNYLLNDFKITTVGKLIYDEEKKEFKYVVATERNDSLYDEIKQIKEEVKANEINLFYKGR